MSSARGVALAAVAACLALLAHGIQQMQGSRAQHILPAEASVPFQTIEDIGKYFNVTLHPTVGASRCKEGKACVGLIMLAALVVDGASGPEACPEFGIGSQSACSFMCGALANVAYHTAQAANFDTDSYSVDVVLMHDASIPDQALELARSLGARTLLLDDSIKRMSCHAYFNANPEGNHTEEQHALCEGAAFDLAHFRSKPLVMWLQQLKLGFTSLVEYDVVAHIDIDMFITNATSLTEELDFYLAHDMALIARMSKNAPLNAGHWVARPAADALKLWLQAVTVDGFSKETGWGDAGDVVPQIWTALAEPQKEVPLGGWDFIGADRDQGLLYYIYALKLDGWYAEAKSESEVARLVARANQTGRPMRRLEKRQLEFRPESHVKFTGSDFAEYNGEGIQHLSGDGKPWDDAVCGQEIQDCDHMAKLRQVLPRLVYALRAIKTSTFLTEFCYPRLADNVEACAAPTAEC